MTAGIDDVALTPRRIDFADPGSAKHAADRLRRPRSFTLPRDRIADAPIEARGHPRDDGLLLVAGRTDGHIDHVRMRDLPKVLGPGDLLVVNDSATLPAAVPAADGSLVHVAAERADGRWIVELRVPCAAGSHPLPDGRAGQVIDLPGGARLTLVAALTERADGVRLWVAKVTGVDARIPWLLRYGRPIRYGCTTRRWPLSAYMTVFATNPGSAEMPSAARGFTRRLVRQLRSRGVELATITLHTGVSSAEAGERPHPEWFRVDGPAAAMVQDARTEGRRVIAVGTTVVRALESAVDAAGDVRPATGWTDLIVTPQRGVQVVDGLLTGWHEPEASHLDLIEAVAGAATLERSYAAAIKAGYLWHEFGDFHLILP
jgi:S-adenosylmethionine:tRNA ribosyltransferase-isomerase